MYLKLFPYICYLTLFYIRISLFYIRDTPNIHYTNKLIKADKIHLSEFKNTSSIQKELSLNSNTEHNVIYRVTKFKLQI